MVTSTGRNTIYNGKAVTCATTQPIKRGAVDESSFSKETNQLDCNQLSVNYLEQDRAFFIICSVIFIANRYFMKLELPYGKSDLKSKVSRVVNTF